VSSGYLVFWVISNAFLLFQEKILKIKQGRLKRQNKQNIFGCQQNYGDELR